MWWRAAAARMQAKLAATWARQATRWPPCRCSRPSLLHSGPDPAAACVADLAPLTRRPAGRRTRGSSSSRTQCPGQCGWTLHPGSGPPDGPAREAGGSRQGGRAARRRGAPWHGAGRDIHSCTLPSLPTLCAPCRRRSSRSPHLLVGGGLALALPFVGGVHVGGACLKLCL